RFARTRHALRSALALARRGEARSPGLRTEAILAVAATGVQGPVQKCEPRTALSLGGAARDGLRLPTQTLSAHGFRRERPCPQVPRPACGTAVTLQVQ